MLGILVGSYSNAQIVNVEVGTTPNSYTISGTQYTTIGDQLADEVADLVNPSDFNWNHPEIIWAGYTYAQGGFQSAVAHLLPLPDGSTINIQGIRSGANRPTLELPNQTFVVSKRSTRSRRYAIGESRDGVAAFNSPVGGIFEMIEDAEDHAQSLVGGIENYRSSVLSYHIFSGDTDETIFSVGDTPFYTIRTTDSPGFNLTVSRPVEWSYLQSNTQTQWYSMEVDIAGTTITRSTSLGNSLIPNLLSHFNTLFVDIVLDQANFDITGISSNGLFFGYYSLDGSQVVFYVNGSNVGEIELYRPNTSGNYIHLTKDATGDWTAVSEPVGGRSLVQFINR